MVNRTGQSFNIPQGDRQAVQVQQIPQVRFATTSAANPNAGQAAYGLAQVMQGISSRVEDRLDAQAASEAARQGRIAGMNGIPVLKDDSTIRGKNFNASARDAVMTDIEVNSRLRLNDLEQQFQANPTKFKNQSESWFAGHYKELESFDPEVAQKFESSFRLQQASAEGRIKDRAMAIERDRQLENSLRLQMTIQDDLARNAAQLFTAKPEETEAVLANLVASAGRMVDVAQQIGPDGRPLFDARQRVTAEAAAEQAISEQIGMAWMRNQPDVLGAYQTWRNGEAVIDIGDDQGNVTQMNLKEFLGERRYQQAENSFMENLRADLSLQAQISTAQERAFKVGSDQSFKDLSTLAQDGGLTLQMVEDSRADLEPDRYLALRTLAKKGAGAAVSDGSALSRLSIADADGNDIRQDLIQTYNDGQLSQDDYLRLYERNSGRIGDGAKNPINAGRDMVMQRLGVLSKEIGIAQSSSIGQAAIEYEIAVDDFIDKNGRQPNLKEIRDLSNDVYERFSAVSVGDSVIALPLPNSMSAAEKLNTGLSTASIEAKIKTVNAQYLQKHGGDIEKMQADEDWISENNLLKQYFDLLKLQETGNERKSSSAK